MRIELNKPSSQTLGRRCGRLGRARVLVPARPRRACARGWSPVGWKGCGCRRGCWWVAAEGSCGQRRPVLAHRAPRQRARHQQMAAWPRVQQHPCRSGWSHCCAPAIDAAPGPPAACGIRARGSEGGLEKTSVHTAGTALALEWGGGGARFEIGLVLPRQCDDQDVPAQWTRVKAR